jgi:anthranilate phosphoribosyltransferase
MKHVAQVRRQLGRRTLFNILGPLANPAAAEFQVLGVGIPALRPLLAEAISILGTTRTFVVSGIDGLGDVTIAGPTNVSEVAVGAVREFQWCPADFGQTPQSTQGLAIASPAESAALVRRVLAGERGAARDIVILNAAAALVAAGTAPDPHIAATRASEAIDSGSADQLLRQLAVLSHRR